MSDLNQKEIVQVPNGGGAILDKDNKLVAYVKAFVPGEPVKDWDFIRKDLTHDVDML
jgi:hypothetical protein